MALIGDLLAARRTVSFEFFPPKSEAAATQLKNTVATLSSTNPDFISVTYGAGGSDRHRTRDVVIELEQRYDFSVMAHLTCIGHTQNEIDELLAAYAEGGVSNILALRGDPPQEGPLTGDFGHACDLVAHLRSRSIGSVGVAAHPEGHPQSASKATDRRHLAHKLQGADFAVTQFFFDVDHYRSLVNDLADLGCTKPVIPGVIPITDASQVQRFAAMAGATIPVDIAARIEAAADDPAEVRRIGVALAAELSQQLLDYGAPGLHFYTLNRAEATLEVMDELSLQPRR